MSIHEIKPDALYTVAEVCAALKARNLPHHEVTVRRWIARGKLEVQRGLTGRIRIQGTELVTVIRWQGGRA